MNFPDHATPPPRDAAPHAGLTGLLLAG
ncbi:molybdenum cofactor guanylyltransferase MobA, partial [Burkholderia sp. Cy-647]|nr:molybdenum cofactor guanylyltransferase MobA [Burkholderia sp. Cy-647]